MVGPARHLGVAVHARRIRVHRRDRLAWQPVQTHPGDSGAVRFRGTMSEQEGEMEYRNLSRRTLLGSLALAGITRAAKPAPASTVAISRCNTYDRAHIEESLGKMFDQIGGIGSLVKNKTVAIKLNLTGQPQRFPIDPALPYRTNPDTV